MIFDDIFPISTCSIILPIEDFQNQLDPVELEIISSASKKRKFEFSTGRWCAKQVLKKEGIDNFPLLTGENREPIWPAGIVGSISHCKDQCGVVIAKKSEVKSIGFDIENIKRLKNDISKIICTNIEHQWLNKQKLYPYDVLVILLFSLKESIYKCVFQHEKVKQGFKDITIIPDLKTNTAEMTFHKLQFDASMRLKFVLGKNHIYSGATCL
jgi:4'-phosphopantetheinyl transferase EntD